MNIVRRQRSDFKADTRETYSRGSHPHVTYWLGRISNLNYGTEKKCKYRKATVISAYNRGHHYTGPSKRQLIDHERGRATIFYMASQNYHCDLIPVIIDIDAHKPGQTHEDCLAYVSKLKSLPMFRDLYHERSTGGEGIHGTVWIEGVGHSLVRRKACARLQRYLQALALPFDVTVEIKGTTPATEFDQDGRLVDIKFGCLCRLPRDLKAAMSSTRLGLVELLRLDVPTVESPEPEPVRKKRKQTGGSTCLVTQEDVDRLPEARRQAEFLMDKWGEYMNQNGTHRTRDIDLALFILVEKWIADHPNDEGHTPCARARAVHRAFQDSGMLPEEYQGRAWHHERYKASRDFTSDLGLVSWHDAAYTPPTYTNGRKNKDGRACSWQLDGAALAALTQQQGTCIPNFTEELIRPIKVLRFVDSKEQDRLRQLWEFEQYEAMMAG